MSTRSFLNTSLFAKAAAISALAVLAQPALAERTVELRFQLPNGVEVNPNAMTLPETVFAYVVDEFDRRHECSAAQEGSEIVCRTSVEDYNDVVELVIAGLDFVEYRRILPTSNDANVFQLGLLNLTKTRHELAIIEARYAGEFGFRFSFLNRTEDPILITSARFLLYPGSAVMSICMPQFYTVYQFPFHAAFGEQSIDLSEGDIFSNHSGEIIESSDLPQDYYRRLFVSSSSSEPYFISNPLEILELVPPNGTASLEIQFSIDEDHNRILAENPNNIYCRWSEVYDAHALFSYNEDILASKRIQLEYVTVPPDR